MNNVFYVYDNNHYQYIPSFITTDIFLQVMHKHFSTLLQKVEQNNFVPLITDLTKGAYAKTKELQTSSGNEDLQYAIQHATTYFAIAQSLVSGGDGTDMDEECQKEVQKIMEASEMGSEFLDNPYFLYSQFEPRGNYTATDTLKQYFRCVKWLNTVSIYINDDKSLLSALLIGHVIKQNPELNEAFEKFNDAIRFIVGDEDNISIATLLTAVSDLDNLESLANPAKLKSIREQLIALRKKDRITTRAGSEEAAKSLTRESIMFTAGRYTFDGEILSRLVHVLNPAKRPFPKGLDVFAVFGNNEAENILLNELNEANQWPAYTDSLQKLKTQFATYNNWNKNIYSKIFETINTVSSVDAQAPLFMKTPSWNKKNLITSLAAWTELKHDMLLYTEQPGGAQAGEGGGPPPPQHVSYVEPNIRFWKNALSLLELQEVKFKEMNLVSSQSIYGDFESVNKELKEIAQFLLNIGEKELAREKISNDEFDRLGWIGGTIEYLTFRIVGSYFLPDRERHVALIADVYNYNGTYLEEAVGLVDEIYVVAEINGRPFLTRGAVFSYYEFNSGSPLTDEAWREQISKTKSFKRPTWVKDITIKTNLLESKPAYSFD